MNGPKMLKTYLKLRNKLKDFVYHFQSQFLKKKEFPEIINIETSILCNAKCKFCPHKNIKRKIDMDFHLIKKIVDEASNYKIKEIHPFDYGEPFLYNRFIESLFYIRRKIPKCKIFVYSNGSAMTDKQMKEIAKNNLLDKVNFSLDAASPKTYKALKGLDYKKTIKKILKFIKLNKKYKNDVDISVSFIIGDLNKKELNNFKKFWKGKARLHIAVDDGRGGTPFINRASKNPCSWLFNRTAILTTGDVVVCCVDAAGKLVVGNVNNNSLKEVWNSPKYERIRKLHLNGGKGKIPLCANCQVRY
jgi:radical SAM protein with 4Fe4S-binding SPASM domain